MKQTLYELEGERLALYELLEESGGEITSEIEEKIIADLFEESDTAISQKLEGYGWVISEFLDRGNARIERGKSIVEKGNRDLASAEALKKRVHAFLQTTDTKRTDTANFRFRRQANGGKTPVVVNEYFLRNPVELPEKYRKVEFKPDLTAIREDLESSDIDLTEVRSIADWGEKGEHLRIE